MVADGGYVDLRECALSQLMWRLTMMFVRSDELKPIPALEAFVLT